MIAAVLLLASCGEFAVTAAVRADGAVRVGDRVTLRIAAESPPGWTTVPPTPPEFLGDFAAEAAGDPWAWSLTPLDGGRLQVPPVEVVFRRDGGEDRTAASGPVAVRVRSAVRPGRAASDLEPLAGRPFGWGPIAGAVVAVAVVAIAARRLRDASDETPAYRRRGLSHADRLLAAAAAIRGRTAGDAATTAEARGAMAGLPEAVRREASETLKAADRVKFGGAAATHVEAADAARAADAVRRAVAAREGST